MEPDMAERLIRCLLFVAKTGFSCINEDRYPALISQNCVTRVIKLYRLGTFFEKISHGDNS